MFVPVAIATRKTHLVGDDTKPNRDWVGLVALAGIIGIAVTVNHFDNKRRPARTEHWRKTGELKW